MGTMTCKKVLVNGAFLTQKVTGGQRYAWELLLSLSKLTKQKYIYVAAVPGTSNKPVPSIPGIEVYYDNSCLPRIVWQQLRLPFLAKKLNADILWSPCNIGPVAPIIPHIITVFDGSIYNDRNWFDWKFKAYYRAVFSMYRYAATRIVTCSNFSKNEITQYLHIPQSRVDVVYGGISDNFKCVRDRKVLNYRYVLSLGSRDPRKNISTLVHAWRQLPASVKKGRFLAIAGGGNKTFADEDLGCDQKDIVFVGYVPDADLPALYSNADCFIYPSFYEGFGLPPLEAMSCGCPVIASNVTSLPEVCGESAFYINPESEESLAAGIATVLSDKEKREKMIQSGYETARRFSWDKSAQKMLQVLEVMP